MFVKENCDKRFPFGCVWGVGICIACMFLCAWEGQGYTVHTYGGVYIWSAEVERKPWVCAEQPRLQVRCPGAPYLLGWARWHLSFWNPRGSICRGSPEMGEPGWGIWGCSCSTSRVFYCSKEVLTYLLRFKLSLFHIGTIMVNSSFGRPSSWGQTLIVLLWQESIFFVDNRSIWSLED